MASEIKPPVFLMQCCVCSQLLAIWLARSTSSCYIATKNSNLFLLIRSSFERFLRVQHVSEIQGLCAGVLHNLCWQGCAFCLEKVVPQQPHNLSAHKNLRIPARHNDLHNMWICFRYFLYSLVFLFQNHVSKLLHAKPWRIIQKFLQQISFGPETWKLLPNSSFAHVRTYS